MCEAENSHDGLDRAAERRPEVVLLDLNMPVMDGFDILKSFRALSRADRALLRGADQILNPGEAGLASVVERLQRLAAG